MLSELFSYLKMDFVQYALISATLISVCSALLGVTLVLKRFSFIGDGLSHVAFGASIIAAIANISDNVVITLPVTIACAILLLCAGEKTKIKGDAAVAMLSVGALAVGYLLINLFPTSGNINTDVCGTMFGTTKIVSLRPAEVWTCVILSLLVVAFFVVFYNRIFAVTFDENFAVATGTRAKLYNFLSAVIIAVVIVLAMNLVGSLLVSALIIFPALSSMRVFKSFRSVIICSVITSTICTVTGFLFSIMLGTPIGPTIVVADIIGFFAFYIAGFIVRGKAA